MSMTTPLLVAAAGATLVAALGMIATDIGPWYRALRKPSWQPPDWLFGPAWTLIFILAAWSAAMGWEQAADRNQQFLLVALFTFNAVLNVMWSWLFFRWRRPDLALVEVVFLWASILLLIVFMWPFAPYASMLLLPYLAWVSFASILNRTIVRLNPAN